MNSVPLKIYAHCIDGYVGTANERITDALGATEPESKPGPSDEGDADGEPAA